MWNDIISSAAKAPSERSKLLAEWVRDYACRRINSRIIDQRRCIPPYIALDLGNHGLLGMQVPIGQGGKLALNHREMFWVLRQFGSIDVTLASFVGLNNCLGVRPVLRYGSAAVHERYLADMAGGRVLGSFALTESCAGSDPMGIAAVARRNGNGFVLSGEKWWSGSAQWAGVINVIARHHDAVGQHRGFVALCVDGNQPGLRHGEESLTVGLHGMVQNHVHFEEANVGENRILGSAYAGMSVAADTMAFGRLAIAAVGVGGLWRALQLMVRYAGKRKIGVGLLYDNDHVQSVIVDTWLAANALDQMVERLATELDNGASLPPEVYAAVKLLSTEILWSSVDATVQMLGGRAYCENNPVAQLWRDVRITRIFEGPSETLAYYLGHRLWEGGHAYFEYLSQHGKERLVSLQQKIETLRGQHPVGAVENQISSRQLIALGEISAWTVLDAYTNQSGQFDAWLQRKLSIASGRLSEPAWPSLPDVDELADLIVEQIGLTKQTLAGELVQGDPYLHD